MRRATLSILSAALLATAAHTAAHAAEPYEGMYVSFDDSTNAPRGLVELVRNEAGELEGFIRGSFIPGEDPQRICDECDDELEGASLLGLRIVRGLEAKDDDGLKWKGGRITDPDNGKTYKSKLTFEPDFSEVKVRGYIGTPALGRSQRWTRATPDDIAYINAALAEFGLAPLNVETNPS